MLVCGVWLYYLGGGGGEFELGKLRAVYACLMKLYHRAIMLCLVL